MYYPMDVDDVPVAGSRPDRLTEVRPQERVLRRTVEQAGDVVPGLPALDAPVPQMVDPAAEVVRFFASLPVVAEQVIEVPTVSEDPIPQRALLRAPQLAEQLVDVPTPPGYVLAVQTLGWEGARAFFCGASRQLRAGYKYWAGLRRGRLCDHAAQVPAVRRVRGGASASVLRQSGGAVAHRDRYTVQTVQKTSFFFRCSSWTRWTCPLLFYDRCVGFTVQKTVEVPQVQYLDRVVDVPAAVHRQGLDVPVSSRRCLRFSSSAELDYDGSEGVFRRILRHFSRSSGYPELSARFQSWSPR